MDSLKGSLTSIEAGEAVKEGIKLVYPDAEVYVRPLADGGIGMLPELSQCTFRIAGDGKSPNWCCKYSQ